MPNQERTFVRMQEKGNVTLPAAVRRRLGLKKGDLFAVEETDAGLLLTPQEPVAKLPTSRIVEVLEGRRLSLEDFLQTSDAAQTGLLKEAFGLPSDAAAEAVSECAKADFFAVVDRIQEANNDKNPDQVYKEVTAAVEEVRQQRYEQQRRN